MQACEPHRMQSQHPVITDWTSELEACCSHLLHCTAANQPATATATLHPSTRTITPHPAELRARLWKAPQEMPTKSPVASMRCGVRSMVMEKSPQGSPHCQICGVRQQQARGMC